MKAFRVTVFNPKDDSDIHEGIIIKAKSEILLKEIVREKGYEIKGNIHEVTVEETGIDKLKNWFSSHFSTSYGFDQKKEIIILTSFSKALRRGFAEKEAIEQSKFSFGKSDTATRKQIDTLIDTYDRKGISHISDVFTLNEEMFSENFLVLMQQAKDTEIKIDKIISNPVPKEKKGQEIEGYVELTESVYHLTTELKQKISKPVFWFLGMFGVVLSILVFLVPFMLEGFKKLGNVNENFYFYVGEITLAVSHYVANYGVYFLIILLAIIGFVGFFYKNNESFKEALHKYLLTMYIAGDTISLIQTKKVASLMAIFHESGMKWEKIFEIIIPLVPYIPMKKELEYIRGKISSHDYDTIFNAYPDEEKYFTEMFYVQLAKESNSYSAMTGRYGMAFASILVNTDDQWQDSVSKYPDKISKILGVSGFAMIGFFAIGIGVIMIVTLLSSLNNI